MVMRELHAELAMVYVISLVALVFVGVIELEDPEKTQKCLHATGSNSQKGR